MSREFDAMDNAYDAILYKYSREVRSFVRNEVTPWDMNIVFLYQVIEKEIATHIGVIKEYRERRQPELTKRVRLLSLGWFNTNIPRSLRELV